jgi:CDP-diacylglycerol--glycerol-3-phosphate 3-phosphatidyltransferase
VTLANRITLVRLVLIPVFCGVVYCYAPTHLWARPAALAIYGVAALTDMLDGWVARRFNQRSRLGMRLDPLADKLLINLGFVFLAANPSFEPGVPLWFPIPIMIRDIIVVIGALLLNAYIGPVHIKVRMIGKVSTLFLNGTLFFALLSVPFLPWLLWAATLLTLASCAQYIYDGIQQLRAGGEHSNG